MARRAFTLLELLIVVAVISLLLALVGGVIASARTAAVLTVCSSNLRQWGTVVMGYAADHRGRVPETMPGWNDLDPASRTYWGILKQEVPDRRWISYPEIRPYFGDDAIAATGMPRAWCCSATPDFAYDQGSWYLEFWTSYAYTAGVSAWSGLASDPQLFTDRRLDPSRLLMGDRLLWTNQAWYTNHPHVEYGPFQAVSRTTLTLNQLFGDGRVGTRRAIDLPLPAMAGGAPVGQWASDGTSAADKAYF